MNYTRYIPKIGDSFQISETMSVLYEKIAEDLNPIWHEVPAQSGITDVEEGTFIAITPDVWFVFDKGKWRMMGQAEHTEASRQLWLSSKIEDDL